MKNIVQPQGDNVFEADWSTCFDFARNIAILLVLST